MGFDYQGVDFITMLYNSIFRHIDFINCMDFAITIPHINKAKTLVIDMLKLLLSLLSLAYGGKCFISKIASRTWYTTYIFSSRKDLAGKNVIVFNCILYRL